MLNVRSTWVPAYDQRRFGVEQNAIKVGGDSYAKQYISLTE